MTCVFSQSKALKKKALNKNSGFRLQPTSITFHEPPYQPLYQPPYQPLYQPTGPGLGLIMY